MENKDEAGDFSLVDLLEDGICLSYRCTEAKQQFFMRGDITTLSDRLAAEFVKHPVLVDIALNALKISQRLRADELANVETQLKKHLK